MKLWSSFRTMLDFVFRRSRIEHELDEEIRSHLELRVSDLQRQGLSRTEAERQARIEFGGYQRYKEECREALGTRVIQELAADIRYGLRQLRRNPGFTTVAVLTLALGIGANTAIFSMVNGVLLQPLPYSDPANLVTVYESTREFSQSSLSYPNFLDWQRENRSFTGIAAYRSDDMNFTGSGRPEHLLGEYVSANFFPLLGVKPLLGRGFLPQEDREGAGGVVALSYALWERRFGGDRDVLGKVLTLNGRKYFVAGVLPPNFRFRDQADLYAPLGSWNPLELNNRDNHPGLHAVARLKPGVTVASAQAEMDSIASQLARQYPNSNAGRGAVVVPMKADVTGNIRPTLLLLLGAVGLVLLIACANVASLMLARSAARSREFAIRAALGAHRTRILRQLLTESMLLALGAGATGLLFAFWGTRMVTTAIPDRLPHSQQIGMDPHVLLFTLGVSVLTGIFFGLAPAFQGSGCRPQEALKEGARGSGGGRRHAESAFVVLEVGLSVVLLAGAGLMTESISRLWKVDPGFDSYHVLTAQVALSPSVTASPSSIRTAFRELLARVDSVPGVQGDAITNLIPLSDSDNEIGLWLGRGPRPPSDKLSSALFFVATPDYLHVMGIPLLRGRFFTNRDTTSSPPVTVIDDVMARQLFQQQNPLGRQISVMMLGPVEVVGVVGHVKHWGLDSDDTAKVRSEMYFPFGQVPDKYMPETISGVNLLVRSAGDPLSVVSSVRTQVAGPRDDQPTYGVRSMEQIIAGSLEQRRFMMRLLIVFASAALLLAAVGIYGVMSYSVGRRTNEIGVRMALGAEKGDVLRMVVGQGLRLAVMGVAIGITGAFALTRFLASLLYGVKPTDPLTFAAVSLILIGVALLACYIPARRASKVDPMVALRYE